MSSTNPYDLAKFERLDNLVMVSQVVLIRIKLGRGKQKNAK